jgi:hypothetical protein
MKMPQASKGKTLGGYYTIIIQSPTKASFGHVPVPLCDIFGTL